MIESMSYSKLDNKSIHAVISLAELFPMTGDITGHDNTVQ